MQYGNGLELVLQEYIPKWGQIMCYFMKSLTYVSSVLVLIAKRDTNGRSVWIIFLPTLF